jgi:hypothetical protein
MPRGKVCVDTGHMDTYDPVIADDHVTVINEIAVVTKQTITGQGKCNQEIWVTLY